jgi:hypothetical protein
VATQLPEIGRVGNRRLDAHAGSFLSLAGGEVNRSGCHTSQFGGSSASVTLLAGVIIRTHLTKRGSSRVGFAGFGALVHPAPAMASRARHPTTRILADRERKTGFLQFLYSGRSQRTSSGSDPDRSDPRRTREGPEERKDVVMRNDPPVRSEQGVQPEGLRGSRCPQ